MRKSNKLNFGLNNRIELVIFILISENEKIKIKRKNIYKIKSMFTQIQFERIKKKRKTCIQINDAQVNKFSLL